MAETPAKSASKAEWVAFAADNGLTEEEANDLSKADLIERFSAGDSATTPTATPPAEGGVVPPTAPPNATTLDSHLDAPSVTAPGDGPADTTDPTERASAATPDFGAAALAGHDTVNAVVPRRTRKAAASKVEHRIEEYEATRPDGKIATVRHNIDTGATEVIGIRDPE